MQHKQETTFKESIQNEGENELGHKIEIEPGLGYNWTMYRDKDTTFNCIQCDYTAKHKSGLRYHISSKHEGLRFACTKCNYKSTSKNYLAKHINKKHDSSNISF